MTMRVMLLGVLFLSACGQEPFLRETAQCPEGYVPVDTAGGEYSGRAISARGVVLAIRERRNEEKATLDFWVAVLRKELTQTRGYAIRSSREVPQGRGTLFTAPHEKASAYYVALFVTMSRIVTVEVAGPESEVDQDLPRLEEFLSTLNLGGA
jgi:hypothetical protein